MMSKSITKEFVTTVIEAASLVGLNVNRRQMTYTCDGVEYTIEITMAHHKRSTGDDTYVIVGHNSIVIHNVVSIEYMVDYGVDPFSDQNFQIDSYKLRVHPLVSEVELEHHVMLIKLQLPTDEHF